MMPSGLDDARVLRAMLDRVPWWRFRLRRRLRAAIECTGYAYFYVQHYSNPKP